MSDELKYKAVAYWQDRLAKFFPKSPGPTTCEIEMYFAGYKQKEAETEGSSLHRCPFRPENHIIGKAYDLTQENMQAMLFEIDRLKELLEGK